MFSIIIKGERNPNNIEFVKLTMVFYKTGYPRLPKVLYITGPYSDWQKVKQCFNPNSADNISKNSLLQKKKLKYLKIAEMWECAGKNWIPIELAHYFDTNKVVLDRYTSVSEIIKQVEQETAERTRIRNGREFDSRRNARTFQHLHNCLERFTQTKYRKSFANYFFRDITEKFIEDFIIYSKREGAKNGTRGGVFNKLHILYKIVEHAQKKKLYNVNLDVFNKFKSYMTEFKLKNMPQHKMYTRVNYINHMVADTMQKVCAELGIPHHITWGTARSSFICKMLDEGYHIYQVAEMTGNSPITIYKHYYGITNREKIKSHLNHVL